MTLRASSPEVGKKPTHILLYGEPKCGKTTNAAQLPNAYFIDCEQGATEDQYVELLKEAGSSYLAENTYAGLLKEVKALGSEKHEFQTLIIDPISSIWDDLLAEGEAARGVAHGAHYGYANTLMKRLFLHVNRLPMNVLTVAHAKEEYTGKGKDREPTGELIPDAWKELLYQFDLVIQLRWSGASPEATVRMSRKQEFPRGEVFEWSYDLFVERLGRSSLERLGIKPVPLASNEQIGTLGALLDRVGAGPDHRASLLGNWRVTNPSDLTEDQANQAITIVQTAVAKRFPEEVSQESLNTPEPEDVSQDPDDLPEMPPSAELKARVLSQHPSEEGRRDFFHTLCERLGAEVERRVTAKEIMNNEDLAARAVRLMKTGEEEAVL